MGFSLVALATSITALVPGVGWLLSGTLLLKRWGLAPDPTALLVGRRLGTTYVGIAILLFLGRSALPSDLRYAICAGLLFALLVLAGLGIFEFRARRAGAAILISVVIEVILALGFAWVMFVEA